MVMEEEKKLIKGFLNFDTGMIRTKAFREKIGRKEAKRLGLMLYHSEKPCKNCGSNMRYVSVSSCASRTCQASAKNAADSNAVETRRRIEEIKEQSQDDYWDSLLED